MTPLDFERGPTIILFVKAQHKMKEKEFPKGVSEKHEYENVPFLAPIG